MAPPSLSHPICHVPPVFLHTCPRAQPLLSKPQRDPGSLSPSLWHHPAGQGLLCLCTYQGLARYWGEGVMPSALWVVAARGLLPDRGVSAGLQQQPHGLPPPCSRRHVQQGEAASVDGRTEQSEERGAPRLLRCTHGGSQQEPQCLCVTCLAGREQCVPQLGEGSSWQGETWGSLAGLPTLHGAETLRGAAGSTCPAGPPAAPPSSPQPPTWCQSQDPRAQGPRARSSHRQPAEEQPTRGTKASCPGNSAPVSKAGWGSQERGHSPPPWDPGSTLGFGCCCEASGPSLPPGSSEHGSDPGRGKQRVLDMWPPAPSPPPPGNPDSILTSSHSLPLPLPPPAAPGHHLELPECQSPQRHLHCLQFPRQAPPLCICILILLFRRGCGGQNSWGWAPITAPLRALPASLGHDLGEPVPPAPAETCPLAVGTHEAARGRAGTDSPC